MIRAALIISLIALPAQAAQTESEYRDMLCGGKGCAPDIRKEV